MKEQKEIVGCVEFVGKLLTGSTEILNALYVLAMPFIENGKSGIKELEDVPEEEEEIEDPFEVVK